MSCFALARILEFILPFHPKHIAQAADACQTNREQRSQRAKRKILSTPPIIFFIGSIQAEIEG